MRKPALYFLVLLLAMQSTVICAQKSEKPKPRFTLTISNSGSDSLGRYVLAVTETNISNEVLREAVCIPAAFEDRIKVTVVYNGTPLEMNEVKPAVQYIKKQEKEGKGHCPTKTFLHEVQPGGGPEGAFEDNLDVSLLYDMSKPGTYEITVSKETFPHNPEKSVTVKSNTLTIIVPEPKAEAPK
jgi:hypothetical protein